MKGKKYYTCSFVKCDVDVNPTFVFVYRFREVIVGIFYFNN